MGIIWRVIKKIAYTIDDIICWFYQDRARRKKSYKRLSLRVKQEIEFVRERLRRFY